jgi:hypothetical protein
MHLQSASFHDRMAYDAVIPRDPSGSSSSDFGRTYSGRSAHSTQAIGTFGVVMKVLTEIEQGFIDSPCVVCLVIRQMPWHPVCRVTRNAHLV